MCRRCDDDPCHIDIALDTSGIGGIHLPDDTECPFVTAGDAIDFARAVMQLYRDELLWNKFSRVRQFLCK